MTDPVRCRAICGDSKLMEDKGEKCDDGNTDNEDGYHSSACQPSLPLCQHLSRNPSHSQPVCLVACSQMSIVAILAVLLSWCDTEMARWADVPVRAKWKMGILAQEVLLTLPTLALRCHPPLAHRLCEFSTRRSNAEMGCAKVMKSVMMGMQQLMMVVLRCVLRGLLRQLLCTIRVLLLLFICLPSSALSCASMLSLLHPHLGAFLGTSLLLKSTLPFTSLSCCCSSLLNIFSAVAPPLHCASAASGFIAA